MAETPTPPNQPQSQTIQLDGDHVVQLLRRAGLDPNKLSVRDALPGAKVDVEELESRLKGTRAPSKGGGGWKVSVSISKD
jgi:hypothetical protein